jgi:hypothetical protein
MKTKSIISSVLLVVVIWLTNGCSTDTIWEEISYGQEEPSYSNGELPAMVQVHTDRVEITLYKNLTHYIYLDGVLIKTLGNEKKVTLRALTPDTEYHLLITALEGEKVLKKETTFRTLKSYATVIGWREMDLYGNNEEVVDFVRQFPGGDFLDFTHRYYNYSEEDYRLRRTDADGRVKWRTNIAVTQASLSEDGHIAAWSYDMACRVNPETGAVVYEYIPELKDGYINGACPCKDGGMAIVGRGNTLDSYYFARLDANGQLIHEEEGNLADELYSVHEMADGNVVAMGKNGAQTLVTITFDASGKVIDKSLDYSENRDFEYRLTFIQSISDNKGNTYFLGYCEITTGGSHPCPIIVKADAQGKIEWTRVLNGQYSAYPSNFYFIEDDKLCVLYSSDKNTHVSFITTGNEHLQDIAFKNNYGALYACPVNEEYSQFILFDSFGRILLVDTEGE